MSELTVHSPYDRSEIASLPMDDPSLMDGWLDRAVGLARRGPLPTWERIEILDRARCLLDERRGEFAMTIAREGGKPLQDAEVEAARAVQGIRSAIETLSTAGGHEVPMGLTPSSADRYAFTSRVPIGTVVAISAFNHPLNLIVHQVVPAVAAGCPVIVKPATATPLSCRKFIDLLHEAGLPEEWLRFVLLGDEEAERLVTDARVAFLTFIGSARVGWMLRSKLAPGTRCALEHGGAAPVIVEPDARLDDIVGPLLKGGFYHAGQVCVSVQRIFAHHSIARDLAERLAEAAAGLVVGDPTLPDTEVGPLIRPAEVDRVGRWIAEARAAGGEILSGGAPLGETTFAPTVVFDPPHDITMSREEIFGPAVAVYPYDDVHQALEQANALPYSFQAAVFAQDIDRALGIARRLDAATVMINDHTAFRVDWMPFAGGKSSGYGIGGIPHTMADMSVEKQYVIHSRPDAMGEGKRERVPDLNRE